MPAEMKPGEIVQIDPAKEFETSEVQIPLRFIERDIGHSRTARILQQLWAVRTNKVDKSGVPRTVALRSEWRDVPLEIEG